VVQTDLLNQIPHLSTLICPLTTQITSGANILRVFVKKGMANLLYDCDIMNDQIRAIDNKRLMRKVGNLPHQLAKQVKDNMLVIFDLKL